eukprot:1144077-Pelagomonas_calceolata.AAC.12
MKTERHNVGGIMTIKAQSKAFGSRLGKYLGVTLEVTVTLLKLYRNSMHDRCNVRCLMTDKEVEMAARAGSAGCCG